MLLSRRRALALCLLALLPWLPLLFTSLGTVPPLWFDEGWNLVAASNYVNTGRYGLILDGQPASGSHLSTGLPVVAPIALSFRIFGVGAWQGRIAGALFVLGGLALLFYLGTRLYDLATGFLATLVPLLTVGPHSHLHAALIGRQALGEMPAVAYLLAGYALFLSPLRWRIAGAALLWALAMASKPQVLPFLALALLAPSVLALVARQQRAAFAGGVALLLALAGAGLLGLLQNALLAQGLPPGASGAGQTWLEKADLVLVLDPVVRSATLGNALPVVPLALALGWGAYRLVAGRSLGAFGLPWDDRRFVVVSLLVLAGAWAFWWTFLSIGWQRYLFPPLFVGSIFVAALVRHLMAEIIAAGAGAHARYRAASIVPLGLLVGLLLYVPPTIATLRAAYTQPDADLPAVIGFLNGETEPDALVETYESELYFLLERRYHYPPNEVQNDRNRQLYLGRAQMIEYDPLATDPDYLVIGPIARLLRLYDEVVAQGAFRLLGSAGRYDVYRRVPN